VFADEMRGGFALDGEIGGQDQFLYGFLGEPPQQLVDADLLGSQAVDGRQASEQDEIAALVAAGCFDGEQIGLGFHHAQQARVAARAGTDRTFLGRGERAAAPAAPHPFGGGADGAGQAQRPIPVALEQVQRHALGALGAHARQAAQGVDEFADQAVEHGLRTAA
jgi:hypothetical protein